MCGGIPRLAKSGKIRSKKRKHRKRIFRTLFRCRCDSVSRLTRSVHDTSRCAAASLTARIGWAACLNRNSTANGSWDTNNLRFLNPTWDAMSLRNHLGFTNLTAGRVGDFSSPNFLSHRAGRVRNLLGDCLTGP